MEWFKMQTVWGASVERLSDAEAGRFIKALFNYIGTGDAYTGSSGREDPITWQAVETLRKDVESFKQSESDYIAHKEAIKAKRQAAARARWSKQTDANACKSLQMDASASKCMQMHDFASPIPPVEKDEEIIKENPLKGVKEKRRFSPPTVDDVAAYCKERGNSVDPERFVDFYASKGWKVGNQSMKDWKAAVRTWEKHDRESSNVLPIKKVTAHQYTQRDYDAAHWAEMDDLSL